MGIMGLDNLLARFGAWRRWRGGRWSLVRHYPVGWAGEWWVRGGPLSHERLVADEAW